MIPGQGNQPRFLFELAGRTDLEVLSFHGLEAVSEPYVFNVEVVCADQAINFDSVVNRTAKLTILGPRAPRYVHGIVLRFELQQLQVKRAHYCAQLVHPLSRLALRTRLRIFQELTTQQIVTKVLTEAGIVGLDWGRLKGSYQPRNYCVQYRETELSFVMRLLEEEGISFHFEHSAGEVKIVFSDAASARSPIAAPPRVIFLHDRSMVPNAERVDHLVFSQGFTVGKVHLRDFSFKQPQAPVQAMATGTDAALETYDFPGEFTTPELAERLAQLRLQELTAQQQSGTGNSDCNRLLPGQRFTLGGPLPAERHPRKALNQEYLLLSVEHCGEQPHVLGEEGGGGVIDYHNTFGIIPAPVEFRPPRLTARPVARNMHTATVVGPKGEEIYVDKFGRVKVHFHWDREGKHDEHASCWIRVAQGWAGAGYGGMFIPRIGQEVLVSFLEGDPDRPLITGRVYNAQQVKGYDAPAQKTLSSMKSASSPGGKGFNELRFEDKAGAEHVYAHAQKNMNVRVRNDRTTLVKHDRQETIKNNDELNVTHKSTFLAEELFTEGTKQLRLKVGQSEITLTPGGIAIRSPAISTASVDTAITGGFVHINPGSSLGFGPKYVTTGLGVEVDAVVNLSPTLAKQVAALQAQGWKIVSGVPGGGSFCDRDKKTLVIDPRQSTELRAMSVAHEVGHALHNTPTPDPTRMSKDQYRQQYRDAMLTNPGGEGEAVFNEYRTAAEMNARGASVTPGYGAATNTPWQQYQTDRDERKAVASMGNAVGSMQPSGTPAGTTYDGQYATYSDQNWDYNEWLRTHPPPPKNRLEQFTRWLGFK